MIMVRELIDIEIAEIARKEELWVNTYDGDCDSVGEVLDPVLFARALFEAARVQQVTTRIYQD